MAGGINPYVYVDNDPVNWIDPWGLLRVDEATAKKYPIAAKKIRSMKANEVDYPAFKKYGQAKKRAVNKAFRSGKGPIVKGADLTNANGEFSQGIKSQELRINNSVLKAFEDGKSGSKTLLESTVKHELTHYFDDQDSKDYKGEEGQLFEEAVYGKDIDTLSDGVDFEKKCP